MLQLFCRHLAGFQVLQPRVARLRGFVRLDARRTEHHDGVANALVLELHERMDVLGEDTYRARRHALEELRVLMADLGRMLGLHFFAVGHVSILQKRRPLIVGIPGGARQRLRAMLRRKEYSRQVMT